MKIYCFETGLLKANCYLIVANRNETYVENGDNAYIIDPGDDGDYLSGQISRLGVKPERIILTHGHFDHIMAAWELSNIYDIPVIMNRADRFLVDTMGKRAGFFIKEGNLLPQPDIKGYIKDGQKIKLAGITGEIYETPGHTPGSICLYFQQDKCIFTGDTLFSDGQIGRTDHAYSDSKLMQKSLLKLSSLPKNTIIYPGHGENGLLGQAVMQMQKIYRIGI